MRKRANELKVDKNTRKTAHLLSLSLCSRSQFPHNRFCRSLQSERLEQASDFANSKSLTPIILKTLAVTFPSGSLRVYVLFPTTRDTEKKKQRTTKALSIYMNNPCCFTIKSLIKTATYKNRLKGKRTYERKIT